MPIPGPQSYHQLLHSIAKAVRVDRYVYVQATSLAPRIAPARLSLQRVVDGLPLIKWSYRSVRSLGLLDSYFFMLPA